MDLLEGATLIKTALESLDYIKNLFGRDKKKFDQEKVQEGFVNIEKSLQLKNAEIAQSIGYPLCRCKFPPEIMVLSGKKESSRFEFSKCPKCGRTDEMDDLP